MASGVLKLPSRFHELPHHASIYHLPKYSLVPSSQLAFRLLQRTSGRVSAARDCHPQSHWIRAGRFFLESSQRGRASRGDGGQSSNSDDEERKDKKNGTDSGSQEAESFLQDEVEVESEDNIKESTDENVPSAQETQGSSWFWKGWWPSRVSNEIKEVTDGEDKGNDLASEESVEVEGERIEDIGAELGNEGEGVENQDTEDEGGGGDAGGDVNREETASREEVPTEQAKTGFWSRIWKQDDKIENEPLGPEEELLLQDLESLTFRWKDLFDPTLENILALALSAVLIIALFKILWQLAVVVATILLSALKYTILAACLVGLLIFLL